MLDIRNFGPALAGILAVVCGPAQSQTSSITIPQSSFECLSENRQKYLDLPRNVLIFTPALCPAISREEVAAIAQNSGDTNTTSHSRVIMLKSEFECLIELIETQLKERGALPEDLAAMVDFELDCG